MPDIVFPINKKSSDSKNSESHFISLRVTIILLVLTTILLIVYVWTRVKAVELTYKYTKLSHMERTLLDRNHKLRLEAASLKSPQRLMSLSKNKLNLK